MPNTLAHIGLGGPATRWLLKDSDLKWIYVGCIIPDVPWILQRVARIIVPGLDPYHVLYYSTVQASLAFCLLLAAALAALSGRFGRTWAILGLNALLHLLLDACEVKWASGVHLFAPFTWRMLSFQLFWLEGPVVYFLTALGLVFLAALWRRASSSPPDVSLRSGRRVAAAAVCAAAYLALPLAFLHGPERADNHYAATLLDRAARPGRYVEIDRAIYLPKPDGAAIRIFSGEELQVEGVTNREPGGLSLRGTFVAENRVRVSECRLNSNRFRDGASKLALILVAAVWLRSWATARTGSRSPRP